MRVSIASGEQLLLPLTANKVLQSTIAERPVIRQSTVPESHMLLIKHYYHSTISVTQLPRTVVFLNHMRAATRDFHSASRSIH